MKNEKVSYSSAVLPKETILREEIRDLRKVLLKTMQWGVTLLASLETVIFFIRQSALKHYILLHKIPEGASLPFSMHIIGTIFLLIVAYICQQTTSLIARRYIVYMKQLMKLPERLDIEEPALDISMKWKSRVLFYVFPAFDILLYLYISEIKIVVKMM